MSGILIAAAMLSMAAEPVPSPMPGEAVVQAGASSTGVLPALRVGTPVHLMVVKEINSRTAALGDRFKLRVNEAIYLNDAIVVPVGTTAWGEIIAVQPNGSVGKGGRLSAKILYIDMPSGRIPLRGESSDRGDSNSAGVVFAVIGFGILGLLNGGDSARLKAGDLVTAYVADQAVSANTQ